MGSDQWYYVRDGQRTGPVSAAELQRLRADGEIGPTDLVWTKGMKDWAPLGTVGGALSSTSGVFSLNEAPAQSTPAAYGGNFDVGDAGLSPTFTGGRVLQPRAAADFSDYAGFWLRFVAYLIDSVLVFVLAIPVGCLCIVGMFGGLAGLAEPSSPEKEALMQLVLSASVSIPAWLYYALCECSSWQATLGKKALGLRVVDLDGEQISFLRASGRFWGKLLSRLTCNIGFIMAGRPRAHPACITCTPVPSSRLGAGAAAPRPWDAPAAESPFPPRERKPSPIRTPAAARTGS